MTVKLEVVAIAAGGRSQDVIDSIGGGLRNGVLIPAAARPGDLVVLQYLYGALAADVSNVLYDQRWANPDPQMAGALYFVPPDEGGGPRDARTAVHYIRLSRDYNPDDVTMGADSRAVPLDWIGRGASDFGFLWSGWCMVVYRNVGHINGQLPRGTYDAEADDTDIIGIGLPYLHADVDQRNQAVIAAVSIEVRGVVAGFPQGDVTGEWTSDAVAFPGFAGATIYRWAAGDEYPRGLRWAQYANADDPPEIPNIESGVMLVTGTNPFGWLGALEVMLLDEVQVTRQYPRDDGSGLIGGPRLYPPPRRGRTFGGQQ